MSEENGIVTQNTGLTILAVLLWIATALISFLLIPLMLELISRVYAAFWSDMGAYGHSYWGGVTLRQFMTLPLAILCVIVTIGGAEYHTRHFNEPSSWKLFARTIAVEAALLILATII